MELDPQKCFRFTPGETIIYFNLTGVSEELAGRKLIENTMEHVPFRLIARLGQTASEDLAKLARQRLADKSLDEDYKGFAEEVVRLYEEV